MKAREINEKEREGRKENKDIRAIMKQVTPTA